ncbi:MAG: threonine synthase [Anaerolineales bacterium]
MPGIIERYRRYLDLPADVDPISLSEGRTPLIPMPLLAAELGAAEIHIKFEGSNPTGSFKDRGMTTAITEAVSRGANAVICASTGNTAASAAAYAARAGLRCVVLLPHGKVASGKLAAAYAHGAEVVEVEGSFDEALGLARRLSERTPIGLVNSLNPYRLEGQKTAAFEIFETLGAAPDWLALPVGNAGNISAYWMGFRQLADLDGADLPHLLGVQASGSAPLVEGHIIEHPETVASAIRIGNPARGEQALSAAEESSGRIIAVPDQSILDAQRDLARHGIWVEPASAAGLAGLRSEVATGGLDLEGQRVVCVCTGHGLKDPRPPSKPPTLIPPRLQALEELLNL